MVKRMCAGHGDSFIHAATELGPTLLVFLAIENIFFSFFKQNLSDSLGGAVLVLSLISSHTVLNVLSSAQCCVVLFYSGLVSNALV